MKFAPIFAALEAQRLRRHGRRRAVRLHPRRPGRRGVRRRLPARRARSARLTPTTLHPGTSHGDTTTRTHHARRHRPDGNEPAPDPLDLRDPRPGRRRARERRQGDAGSDPDRPQCRQDRGAREGERHRPLGHRPRRRARQQGRHDLLRRRHDADAADAARQGALRRQARLLREADRDQPQRGGRDRAHGAGLGAEARRGPGQALPAGPAQARHAAPRRLLRPHAVAAPRVRLLGVRGRPPADPAAVVELPQRRRRRHDPRHDVPLALRARQPVRRSAVGVVPRRDPHPDALGRGRQALPRDRRRRRLRDRAAQGPRRRADRRPAQHVVGDARAPRRPRHLPRRRHRRLGGRRPARLPRPAARRDAAAGVESRRQAADATSSSNGRTFPTRTVYDNGFKIQWEHFIRHVVDNEPYKWTLGEGAKGVQLVEAALESWKARRWIDVAPLAL